MIPTRNWTSSYPDTQPSSYRGEAADPAIQTPSHPVIAAKPLIQLSSYPDTQLSSYRGEAADPAIPAPRSPFPVPCSPLPALEPYINPCHKRVGIAKVNCGDIANITFDIAPEIFDENVGIVYHLVLRLH